MRARIRERRPGVLLTAGPGPVGALTPCLVVHYHEISLKGGNRPLFLRRLSANLAAVTADCGVRRARRLPGRLVLDLDPAADQGRLRERVREVFGIANFAIGLSTPPRLDAVKEAVSALLAGRPIGTFRVSARRTFKVFPMTSTEVNRELGTMVLERFGGKVDLTAPSLTVHVELIPGEALVYVDRQAGPGGLPVGVSGRVVALLSGGIDSPVAAYRMQKRGCIVEFVHFHAVPYLSAASQAKARALVGELVRRQLQARLWLVPFGELQRQVVLSVPPPLRVVVYRRLMARIAEALATRAGALALVTGESLGQVASQTLEHLARISEAVALPILRPLIGTDKEEIVREARAIGTYDISVEPDQDCCSLFVPAHPATRTGRVEAEAAESRLDVAGMVGDALAGAVSETFRFPPAEDDTTPGS